MTALCEEFGISRKTGYKIVQRDQQSGVRGWAARRVSGLGYHLATMRACRPTRRGDER